jgi:hypothetical protein
MSIETKHVVEIEPTIKNFEDNHLLLEAVTGFFDIDPELPRDQFYKGLNQSETNADTGNQNPDSEEDAPVIRRDERKFNVSDFRRPAQDNKGADEEKPLHEI